MNEEFFEVAFEGEPTPDDFHRAIRTVTQEGKAVPVLCGSALGNKGIQPLLDAIPRYLPSPIDRKAVTALNKQNEVVHIQPKGYLHSHLTH